MEDKYVKLTVCGKLSDVIGELSTIVYLIAKGTKGLDSPSLLWKLEED